jgi:hypothetical protein
MPSSKPILGVNDLQSQIGVTLNKVVYIVLYSGNNTLHQAEEDLI